MLSKLLKKRSPFSVKRESLGVCLTALIHSEGAGWVQATTCRKMPLCCELRARTPLLGDEHLRNVQRSCS